MLKNYLNTAWRIMLRQKSYAAINILGLSIGVAATLLIILYIADEWRYDRFHYDAANLYRIGFSGRLQGNEFVSATSPAPLAEEMKREIPEVTAVVRFGLWRTMPMAYEDKSFTENHFLLADSNFFSFFSFPLVKGNARTALNGPKQTGDQPTCCGEVLRPGRSYRQDHDWRIKSGHLRSYRCGAERSR
jgi:putative ABC transport system permease protein